MFLPSKVDIKGNLYKPIYFLFILATTIPIIGCAAHRAEPVLTGNMTPKSEKASPASLAPTPPKQPAGPAAVGETGIYRPPVTWKPSYSLKDVKIKTDESGLPRLKVGADITAKNGKVPLGTIIKKLADLKHMNVSWASDVKQDMPVDVNISADDDFWNALRNILRQIDYSYKYKDNTLIIKYKETQRFYLPTPFLTASYKTSVGGDFLGSEQTSENLKGTLSVEHSDKDIDLWGNIQQNLDKILSLATTQAPAGGVLSQDQLDQIRQACRKQFPLRPAQQALCMERAKTVAKAGAISASSGEKTAATAKTNKEKGNREGFYYTIDKPLGIITVTAPRSLLDQVDTYLTTIARELSRQVIIEAKIIEVQLNDESQKGIDWSDLLKKSPFDFNMTFGNNGQIYPTDGIKLISKVNLAAKGFELFVNFLGEYGKVKVLSNPKLSLMNGQPAMLTVGESVKYIDSVSSTVDSETGIITYTVDTKSILSGLGLGVVANISSDGEIILHLTPVTSKLQEPIEYKKFGSSGSESEVGLPRVHLRELTTMARVKSGQMLVLGGLIDDVSGKEGNKVPILGDVPVVGNAFKSSRTYTNKRELIILLRPQIVQI